MELTNPVGRPTKYKPELCQVVIDLGSIGKSKVQMACACDVVSTQVLDGWAEQFEEFNDALNKAMLLSQNWWENQGQEGVFDGEGKRLNASYTKQMAARFPKHWRDNSGIELSGRVETVAVAKFAEREDG